MIRSWRAHEYPGCYSFHALVGLSPGTYGTLLLGLLVMEPW
jgi:hypothetical protein